MTKQDQNVETARYQKDIATRLGLDSDNLIFNYKQKNETVRLDLVTVNPKHDQSFLFHSIMYLIFGALSMICQMLIIVPISTTFCVFNFYSHEEGKEGTGLMSRIDELDIK